MVESINKSQHNANPLEKKPGKGKSPTRPGPFAPTGTILG